MTAFTLNGKPVRTSAADDVALLTVLAHDMGLNGCKFGCGRAQCGACTVLVDQEPTRACLTPVAAVTGRQVTTLEGLQREGGPGRLQQAFIDEQAAQCGYCSSGMIMQAQALLHRNPHPSDAEVRAYLDGNLCRCGAHNRIVRAVLRASREA